MLRSSIMMVRSRGRPAFAVELRAVRRVSMLEFLIVFDYIAMLLAFTFACDLSARSYCVETPTIPKSITLTLGAGISYLRISHAKHPLFSVLLKAAVIKRTRTCLLLYSVILFTNSIHTTIM
jgi:hypothetical protein